MPAFRKKPVVVEAVHWDGSVESFVSCSAFAFPTVLQRDVDNDGGLGIETLEGRMTASVGDWIIRGVKGELYPCRNDIFDATYDPAESIGHEVSVAGVDTSMPTGRP